MSATLVAKDLAAGHGDRVLFSGLDLVVAPGDVIGLVGANGAGKSTLLRTLAGAGTPGGRHASRSARPPPPSATCRRSPTGARARRCGTSSPGAPAWPPPSARWTPPTEALADGRPGADDAYADGAGALARAGRRRPRRARRARSPPSSASAVDLDQPMTALSGGQAARAGLASLLLSRYDIFLLDEPTNDLDLDGLDRLERFVTGLRAGTVLVSHDREFLTRTVTRVVELDLAQQQVSTYGGGYDVLPGGARAWPAGTPARSTRSTPTPRPALEARARTQRDWMEKGVRNARRKATDNDKIGRKFRGEATREAGRQGPADRAADRAARRRRGAAQGVGAADGDRRRAPGRRGRGHPARRGGPPRRLHASARSTCRSTGRTGSRSPAPTAPASPPCSPRCSAGSRSTTGHARARARRGRRRGRPGARRCSLGDEPLMRRVPGRACPDCADADVRTLLAKFGLRRRTCCGRPRTLSPGERTRAALALLQARGVNLLVLDEPTNHLDLPAIEQLESALAALPGHAAAGHPRPPDARRGAHHPPYRGRRRTDHRPDGVRTPPERCADAVGGWTDRRPAARAHRGRRARGTRGDYRFGPDAADP